MDSRGVQADHLILLRRPERPRVEAEYPIKRRRTRESSRTMHVDAHKLCALAIAADIDLFGHLDRIHDASTSQLAAVTGVEASLLDSIMRTLAADGWLEEVGAEHFAANQVTHAMTDPDFQSLVAHCYEMGLPAALATPRFLNSINFKEPQDAALMAWHVSKARKSGFIDYLTQVDT
ncbi:hypothetical protein CERZMDRAFT_108037 [Cercospora zeae-maydis SCOH1-5]|uniref:Acetylserotonin O-methyltransferase dimerisation domain-containing protein n=1 Tax=Cercospora zeae-maydis SCOH1-5 TaxID=717836 RepID=A0A6A6EYT3_9PEZI|nr:hypothetical protein CERZMDRAFT_108037 [Cercospora zeae-maydis SCOH1-5]